MRKISLTITGILLTILCVRVLVSTKAQSDIEFVPAKWRYDLSSTYLTDYKKGEHLILSSISTGTPGVDAVQKYGLRVKIEAWDKPFSTTYESLDTKEKEVLTVTLHETTNPQEMKAEFEDTVYQDGQIFLKFSGITILVRVN